MTSRNRTSSAVSIESKPATMAKTSHPLPVAKMLNITDPGTSPFGSALRERNSQSMDRR